jgi:hypothetical protein
LRLANPLYFIRWRYVFSTHSYKLFGTTGIARGILITKIKKCQHKLTLFTAYSSAIIYTRQ